MPQIDTGDTAWVLCASALVLFMTPGLALFYGGMVRAKNVLAMLMQNFFAMGIVTVLWVLFGYSLAFGDFGNGGWIGNLDYVGLKDVGTGAGGGAFFEFLTIPFVLFCAFQMTFAIITPALICGAFADRMKFSALLWFGWFGFNAGSALAANGIAAQAFMNTFVAAAAAMLGWLAVERIKTGHATTLGAASGAVAGLVAITPCAGFVGGLAPVSIGAIAGAVCFLAISLKSRFGYDDSLDVVAVHLVGGIVGSILLGLFADKAINPAGTDGVLLGGGWGLFGEQVLAVAVVLAFSFVVSAVIGFALRAFLPGGIRVTEEEEQMGLDITQHSETGYALERV